MGGAELHAHTTASDGTFTPTKAVERAITLGLDALAITDHDTFLGIPEARTAAAGHDIEIIGGAEISCYHDGTALHMLAFWPDENDPSLAGVLSEISASRVVRARKMVERLNELGHDVTYERVMHFAGKGNPGRPHVAEAMVEAGIVSSISAAFTKSLIGDGGEAYVRKMSLAPSKAVELVNGAGGAAVIAHPGGHKGKQPIGDDLIRSLAEAGLAGIEVVHFDHDEHTSRHLKQLARELSLVATSGSDCHGERYDPIRMGMNRTPMQTVEELRAKTR